MVAINLNLKIRQSIIAYIIEFEIKRLSESNIKISGFEFKKT